MIFPKSWKMKHIGAQQIIIPIPLPVQLRSLHLDIYENDGLVQHARKMGFLLKEGLKKLAGKHPSLGTINGSGLFYMAKLVRDRQTAEPLCDQRLSWE